MTWAIGVQTWNDPTTCIETLEALRQHLVGDHYLIVLDNGSDEPLTLPADPTRTVLRAPRNHGAGGGLSVLVEALLATGADALIYLEDDWTLERPLDLAVLNPFVADETVGQVRLGRRATTPPTKYFTYGFTGEESVVAAAQAITPLHTYPDGHYQRVRILWSNNPFACRASVARQFLLAGEDELRLSRRQWSAGLWTISTTPGYFRHAGTIRERRERAGWKK